MPSKECMVQDTKYVSNACYNFVYLIYDYNRVSCAILTKIFNGRLQLYINKCCHW